MAQNHIGAHRMPWGDGNGMVYFAGSVGCLWRLERPVDGAGLAPAGCQGLRAGVHGTSRRGDAQPLPLALEHGAAELPAGCGDAGSRRGRERDGNMQPGRSAFPAGMGERTV